jgi:hypothetical protein
MPVGSRILFTSSNTQIAWLFITIEDLSDLMTILHMDTCVNQMRLFDYEQWGGIAFFFNEYIGKRRELRAFLLNGYIRVGKNR